MKSKPTRDTALNLYKAVLTLKNTDECVKFFSCLCTPLEINTMSRRLQVAKMLYQNEVYLDIANETTVSTATISRVKRAMEADPATYDRLFERLSKEPESNLT
jgi:TrpR-related protein YerC/YecD